MRRIAAVLLILLLLAYRRLLRLLTSSHVWRSSATTIEIDWRHPLAQGMETSLRFNEDGGKPNDLTGKLSLPPRQISLGVAGARLGRGFQRHECGCGVQFPSPMALPITMAFAVSNTSAQCLGSGKTAAGAVGW